MRNTAPKNAAELEALETREWLESLDYVLQSGGPARVGRLLRDLHDHARRGGVRLPFTANTPYINTIPASEQPPFPGSREIERRIKSLVRWNALAMVVKANKLEEGIGGHISTYASAATLYEVGFNHFFKGKGESHDGDIIYFQGHAAPGIYARAFLEGRIDAARLENFRRELKPGGGLSSYPHPWLMPDFWEFPTVSMGLGPINAIYQARFMRYLEDRGLKKRSNSKVWAFVGDGETDEPESLGAITLASREKLDNLIFVINCNLQRLDGPVRGNGQIIQELEAIFRGAGWNVLKVIWGSEWDALLEKDSRGAARQADGRSRRRRIPEVRRRIRRVRPAALLGRGPASAGHGEAPVRRATEEADAGRTRSRSRSTRPTRRLSSTPDSRPSSSPARSRGMASAKRVKARTSLTSRRSSTKTSCARFAPASAFRLATRRSPRRRSIARRTTVRKSPISRSGASSSAASCRSAIVQVEPLKTDSLPELFAEFHKGSEGRKASTTMAFVRMLAKMLRDKEIGELVVPIVPDEARTFGMEALFRQVGIYSHVGQLYEPVDMDTLLYYKEATDGQILEEGITEAGSISSFIAAGTRLRDARHQHDSVLHLLLDVRHAARRRPGVGRGRFAHARVPAVEERPAGRRWRAKGCSTRTVTATCSRWRCRTCSPTTRRLPTRSRSSSRTASGGCTVEGESIFYYITVMNEQYEMPPMPDGAREGILKGMYRLRAAEKKTGPAACAAAWQRRHSERGDQGAADARRAYNVAADVWSVTSYQELYRDGHAVERWNRLHPAKSRACPM